MSNCLVCERIEQIKQNKNKHFVCELETSYVVFGDSQFYRGYSLLLSKYHCTELHHFSSEVRRKYLEEMAIVSEAVFKVFKPQKLNYELLGNRHPHLHWHLFPRYSNDPDINNPVWGIDTEIRNNTFLGEDELNDQIKRLQEEIILSRKA
jgi:diadenosine tetraphosphate (Ap4A) HIT family hydrolase